MFHSAVQSLGNHQWGEMTALPTPYSQLNKNEKCTLQKWLKLGKQKDIRHFTEMELNHRKKPQSTEN